MYRDPKKKTETVTFRVNSAVRLALEEDAKRLGINLNTLVSQIFSRYASWDRYAGQLKFLPVSKDLLREMFQPMQQDAVEKVARKLGEVSAREQILFLFQQMNLGSVIRFIELWSNHFDAYEHRFEGKKHFFTLHHDVNMNFSVFTKEYLSTMLQATLARNLQFENVSPNSVTFSFET